MDDSGASDRGDTTVQTAAGLVAFTDLASGLETSARESNVLTVNPADVAQTSLGAQAGLDTVDASMLDGVVSTARTLGDNASQGVTWYLLGGVVGLVIAFGHRRGWSSRSITRPLSAHPGRRRPSPPAAAGPGRAAPQPRGRRGEAIAETLTPIEVDSHDEIGDLADAFNSIQAVTVDVAEEQGRLLRKGIGDIFVNLARRNQSLLDRQIEFIDQLESNERDPDQLDNLFKLDHLATRMRRNAESLLVLAGADPPRRRGRAGPGVRRRAGGHR